MSVLGTKRGESNAACQFDFNIGYSAKAHCFTVKGKDEHDEPTEDKVTELPEMLVLDQHFQRRAEIHKTGRTNLYVNKSEIVWEVPLEEGAKEVAQTILYCYAKDLGLCRVYLAGTEWAAYIKATTETKGANMFHVSKLVTFESKYQKNLKAPVFEVSINDDESLEEEAIAYAREAGYFAWAAAKIPSAAAFYATMDAGITAE